MADAIVKFIAKLSIKEREKILGIFRNIYNRNFATADIKKLKGNNFIFRVRVGKLRIIYSDTGRLVKIIHVGYRNDGTYKDF